MIPVTFGTMICLLRNVLLLVCLLSIAAIGKTRPQQEQDTSYINAVLRSSEAFILTDVDSAMIYGEKALILSTDTQYYEGQVAAFNALISASGYAGNPQQARTYAYRLFKLQRANSDPIGEAVTMSKLASVYMAQGNYDSTRYYMNKAMPVLENNHLKADLAIAYNTLGNMKQKQGNYVEAINALHKSYFLNEELNREGGMADVSNNMGVIYEMLGEYDTALSHYNQAYLTYAKVNDKVGEAIGLHNSGIILRKTGKLDSALYNFKAAKIVDQEVGALDGVAYDLKEIGDTYYELDMQDSAYMSLSEALGLATSIEDPVLLLSAQLSLGKVQMSMGNYDSAEYYFRNAFDKSKSNEMRNEQRLSAKALSEYYEKRNNTNDAFHYYKIYRILDDSLFDQENFRKISQLEAKYAYDKKLLGERVQQLEKEQALDEAIWIRNTLMIGVFLLLLFAVYTYRNFKIKQYSNRKLRQLNNEVNNQKEELYLLNETLEEKVIERTNELAEKNDQLQLKNRKLANYAFYNAHKLRAPLANVIGLTNLFAHPAIEDDEKQLIADKIIESTGELDEVVSEMQRLLDEK